MSQYEMDREIEIVRDSIIQLSKRKYIRKSELINLLRGCRNNELSLEDIERIMLDVIDDDVEYIDDTSTSNPFHTCTTLQDELINLGYEDIFDYLKVDNEITLEEITLEYQRQLTVKEMDRCYGLIGLILNDNDTFDLYRNIILLKLVINELADKRRKGIMDISKDERAQLVNMSIVTAFLEEKKAELLVDKAISEYGLTVDETNERAITITEDLEISSPLNKRDGVEKKEKTFDEFLIPSQNDNDHQGEEKSNVIRKSIKE